MNEENGQDAAKPRAITGVPAPSLTMYPTDFSSGVIKEGPNGQPMVAARFVAGEFVATIALPVSAAEQIAGAIVTSAKNAKAAKAGLIVPSGAADPAKLKSAMKGIRA